MRIEDGRIMNDFIEPNKRQYAIPVYQRNYECSREQCEKLFDDIILVFIRLLPDYYYARKYNMDELHSVEKLLQKHPEAEPKIRKTVPGEQSEYQTIRVSRTI